MGLLRGTRRVLLGGSTTLFLQPGAVAALDTWIDSANATTNKDGQANLFIGEDNSSTQIGRALLKFDLTLLPANAVILRATLSLYILADFSSNARVYQVYPVTVAWTEAGATWDAYDGVSAWPGGAGGGADIGASIGSAAFTATETVNNFKDFNLTVTAKSQFGTNGLMVKADTETNDMYQFASSDHATAGLRPKLTIVYS